MAYEGLVKLLVEDLKLKRPPIGMAFLAQPPPGVMHYGEAVPSACSFWRVAQDLLFYTTPEDHYNCPIGALTQGFQLPDEVMQQATTLIESMGKLRYLQSDEVASIPLLKKGHQVVVYGPLKEFETIELEVALLIGTPYQAMILSEATEVTSWSRSLQAHVMGRPACAVIPGALAHESSQLSMACMGARTFAGLKDEELILAIPARELAALERKLSEILAANADMRSFYQEQKSRFTSA